MNTIKYAVLEHHMNINGNRVSKILAVREDDFIIFNVQCYEFEIPERVRCKLKMKPEDKLITIKKTKINNI